MAELLLFGPARRAAGERSVTLPGDTAGAVVAAAVERFGPELEEVCARSQIWVNGEPAEAAAAVGPDDEVAVVPPMSGGCVS